MLLSSLSTTNSHSILACRDVQFFGDANDNRQGDIITLTLAALNRTTFQNRKECILFLGLLGGEVLDLLDDAVVDVSLGVAGVDVLEVLLGGGEQNPAVEEGEAEGEGHADVGAGDGVVPEVVEGTSLSHFSVESNKVQKL
eukprot:143661_1